MRQYEIDIRDDREYPIGLTRTMEGIHVSVVAAAKTCSLLLFLPETGRSGKNGRVREPVRIPFPEESRMGDVWEMTVRGEDFERYEYAFEADGELFSDPRGRLFHGREQWGRPEQVRTLLKTPIRQDTFDWEGDRPLRIPYEDCVAYCAHVRGLTKHGSSGVSEKGTFHGVIEKIPYLKELGITTLELLPVAEFQEVMMPEHPDGNPYGEDEPTGQLNYWGYAPALLFAPKASYAGRRKNPVQELKSLVKALHQAGIELVLQFYFNGKEAPSMVLEAVRYWVREYHLDGVHLQGQAPAWLLAQDPYLAQTKLWATSWDGVPVPAGRPKHLGEYNDGFLVDMRRVLKGDEEQMNNLIFRNKRNPAAWGVLNYIAGTNGFTMMDMVSYELKHNEANGENNRDGNDYNYSWNCGVEGPVRKRKLVELRRKQLRNALLLVFLSQGTPLLLAGDEFGNTQNGNNNAYCQDNEISWLNWNQLKTNHSLHEFVKYVIAFRKAHPVFHMSKEPRVMDYLVCGHPDISYHGVKAWCPEFDNFRRQMGIMYCGDYGVRPDGSRDDYFFVTYNMHWEPHEFALPNLPKGRVWHMAFNTDDAAVNGYYEPGQEPELENQKQYMVPPRTILVLIGKQKEGWVPEEEQKERKSRKRRKVLAAVRVEPESQAESEVQAEPKAQAELESQVEPESSKHMEEAHHAHI
ncbi:MAG: alpha-amylase family glycosyl hydrolase [Eubacteriales bacterium]|nr:alpha-amylase family glycosyl hydrolase [Eubacteriales bacterium]